MILVNDLLMAAALNVLISSIIGSVMYGIWHVIQKKWRSIRGVYIMLHLVVWIMFLPVFLLSMWIRHEGNKGIYGFLSMVTPVIRVILEGVVFVWTIGALINLLRYVCGGIHGYIRSREWMEANQHYHQLASEAADALGIRRRVTVREGYTILTPELGGWLSPEIRMPVQSYEDPSLRHIFTHELIHFRYRDRLTRELMVLVHCVHWYNPMCLKIREALKTWDEYHCDYCIAQREDMDLILYAETLDRVLADAQEKKSLLTPGFGEDKSNLRRRLERMMHYGHETTRDKRRAVLAAVMFFAVGMALYMFAGETVAYAYDGVIETSVVWDDAEPETEVVDGMVEYAMAPDDTLALEYVEDNGMSPFAAQGFSCTLKDQIFSTYSFRLEEGDQLTVSVGVTPSDVMVKVGIQQPNAVWRYVYADGNIIHTFNITQTGAHKVFIWNETDTEVEVVGYYYFE